MHGVISLPMFQGLHPGGFEGFPVKPRHFAEVKLIRSAKFLVGRGSAKMEDVATVFASYLISEKPLYEERFLILPLLMAGQAPADPHTSQLFPALDSSLFCIFSHLLLKPAPLMRESLVRLFLHKVAGTSSIRNCPR